MFYKTINTKQTYPFMSDFVGYIILREDFKKNGLFRDIDPISFNTHHHLPRMTYDKNDKVMVSLPPTHSGEIMTYS